MSVRAGPLDRHNAPALRHAVTACFGLNACFQEITALYWGLGGQPSRTAQAFSANLSTLPADAGLTAGVFGT
jgi:hypothetical protein